MPLTRRAFTTGLASLLGLLAWPWKRERAIWGAFEIQGVDESGDAVAEQVIFQVPQGMTAHVVAQESYYTPLDQRWGRSPSEDVQSIWFVSWDDVKTTAVKATGPDAGKRLEYQAPDDHRLIGGQWKELSADREYEPVIQDADGTWRYV